MTNPLQTIPNLPAVTGLGGNEEIWVNQSGTDRRTTSQAIANLAIASIPLVQVPFIGLGMNISNQILTPYILIGQTDFLTTGFYTDGDGGGAHYYHNTGSAQAGDQISADGVRLSLSLSQQLTWEQLGAPSTGAIFTASITNGVMTITNFQNFSSVGLSLIGMTLTAAGGTGTVLAGTTIVSGSGFIYTLNNSQTVGSVVMVANDSYPYVSAALQLGRRGIISTARHWFSQSTVVQGSLVNWSGPSAYGVTNNPFPAIWYYPIGYSGIVVVPTGSATVNAQGDVTLSGTAAFGGANGSSFSQISVQIGTGALPATTVNHRPGIAIYAIVSFSNFTIAGADGDGVYIFGNAPSAITDKGLLSDFYINSVYDNGIETAGGDSNTWKITNGIVSNIGASGIYEHGFLGNGYSSIQSQTTGQRNSNVVRSGNAYYSLVDNNIGNDPVSSPTQWALWFATGAPDTWVSGTTYRIGSSYRTGGGSNISEFISCYSESDAPPALFQANAGGIWKTSIFGGLLAAGIDLVHGGYNGFALVGEAPSFIGYRADTYAFDTTGLSAAIIGYRANNTNASPGVNTAAVFDTAINSVLYGRFGGRPVGAHKAAYISAFTAAPAEVQMQYWDATGLLTAPFTDNQLSLGIAANRWADLRSVLINGQLPGVSADNGDAPATLTVGSSSQSQLWNTVLTAARAVTLSTTGAINGSEFRIIRGSGATGSFNLNVGTGPLKALAAAGAWVDVEYNGSAWIETASGSL